MKRPNIDKSRDLRKKSTDAERKLWSLLRNRQLEGAKFRRQFSIDDYILDFYAPEYKLAVEADGGQHYADAAIIADEAREHDLKLQGIRILRFSNRDILLKTEGVCEVISRALREMPPSP